MNKDETQPSVEFENLATLRYQCHCTRNLIMAPFADMAKFMAEKHQIADKSITPHRASLFMQMMDSAKLSEYVKSHRLYCGSVSTGEVLYTPIGFCCVERIGRDLDATGFFVFVA